MGNMVNREDATVVTNGRKAYPVAKAFLEQVWIAERKVKMLEIRIENLRMLLTGSPIQLSDMPRSDSPDQERMATLYAEIDELEREKVLAEKEQAAIRMEVGHAICQLSDPLAQTVLMKYYLDHLKWNQIVDKAHICLSQVYYHRDWGYAEMEKTLSENGFPKNPMHQNLKKPEKMSEDV